MFARTFLAALGTLLLFLSGLVPMATAFSRAPQPMTELQAADASNDFAWDLYRQLAGGQGNLFFSPTSIDLALVMTWTGARDETAQDMGSVLRLAGRSPEDPIAVATAYGSLQNTLARTDAPYTLRIANRLWGQAGYSFLPTFLNPLERDFAAGLQEVDFVKDPEGARQTINAWVENRTEDKIKNLLPAGSLGPDIRLVLTNAIYFLGQWQSKFQGSDTAERPFHLTAGEETQTPTMFQTHRFAYAESDRAQVVVLPYQDGDLEMVVMLPREIDGLSTLEKELGSSALTAWTADLEPKNVRLWLPKFSLTGEFSLAKVLGQMGMASAFNQGADFSGMADGKDLFISDVIHKSFIDVYEKGTEAAAATAVTMSMTSMPGVAPETVTFRADHPFLFMIRHAETGAILFLGRVTDPRS